MTDGSPVPSLTLTPSYQDRRKRSTPALRSRPSQYSNFCPTLVKDSRSKVTAIQLISTSVASQWQTALWSLCVHPLNVAGFCLLLYIFVGWYVPVGSSKTKWIDYWQPQTFVVLAVWTVTVVVTAGVIGLAVRRLYSIIACGFNVAWLDNDEVVVIRQGSASAHDETLPVEAGATLQDDVMGALVFSMHVRETQLSKGRKRKFRKGFIRGWAVRPQDQHLGVGTTLLKEAARIVLARGGEGLWFAEDHARKLQSLLFCNVVR